MFEDVWDMSTHTSFILEAINQPTVTQWLPNTYTFFDSVSFANACTFLFNFILYLVPMQMKNTWDISYFGTWSIGRWGNIPQPPLSLDILSNNESDWSGCRFPDLRRRQRKYYFSMKSLQLSLFTSSLIKFWNFVRSFSSTAKLFPIVI